jgi:hypothetical protein
MSIAEPGKKEEPYSRTQGRRKKGIAEPRGEGERNNRTQRRRRKV